MQNENEKAVKGNRVILCEVDQFGVNQTVIFPKADGENTDE